MEHRRIHGDELDI